MARSKGTFNFSANLEPKVQAPLDARTVVDTVAELTQAATWQDTNSDVWLFDGLVVSIAKTGELYMLTNKAAYTSAASWKRIDGGGAESDVYMVGDITTLTNSSDEREIISVVGNRAAFDAAWASGKIIVTKRPVGDSDGFMSVVNVTSSQNGLMTHLIYNKDATTFVDVGLISSSSFEEFAGCIVTEKSIATKGDLPKIYTYGNLLGIVATSKGNEVSGVFGGNYDDFAATNNADIVMFKDEDGRLCTALNVYSTLQEDGTGHMEVTLASHEADASEVVFRHYSIDRSAENVYTLSKDVEYSRSLTDVWINKFTKTEVKLVDLTSLWKLTTSSDDNTVLAAIPQLIREHISGTGEEMFYDYSWIDTSYYSIPVGIYYDPMSEASDLKISEVRGGELWYIHLQSEPGDGYTSKGHVVDIKKIQLNNLKISDVSSGDKVLEVGGDGVLSSVLNLTYNSGTKRINLLGKGNAQIASIDATDFIKDGMVQNVELEGNNLVFTFNTDAGTEEITVDLTKFIDVYTQGNGIAISGKAISAKVDTASENYLTVGAAGIKLSGIDAAIEAAITEAFSWHEVGE